MLIRLNVMLLHKDPSEHLIILHCEGISCALQPIEIKHTENYLFS